MIECATNSKLDGFCRCLRRLSRAMDQQPSGLLGRSAGAALSAALYANAFPRPFIHRHNRSKKGEEGCTGSHRPSPTAMHSHRSRDGLDHSPSSSSSSAFRNHHSAGRNLVQQQQVESWPASQHDEQHKSLQAAADDKSSPRAVLQIRNTTRDHRHDGCRCDKPPMPSVILTICRRPVLGGWHILDPRLLEDE
jgi:hypothetical protein